MSACLGFPENVCISSSLLFKVTAEVGKLLGEEKVDAILCVAGGWAGGNAKSKCESSFELLIHSVPPLVQRAWIGWVCTTCQVRCFSVWPPGSLRSSVR